jgi:hypothetical protein
LDIDSGQLEKEFYALNRKLHLTFTPQLLNKSAPEPGTESLLNDAYRTLKDRSAGPSTCCALKASNQEQSKAATEKRSIHGRDQETGCAARPA